MIKKYSNLRGNKGGNVLNSRLNVLKADIKMLKPHIKDLNSDISSFITKSNDRIKFKLVLLGLLNGYSTKVMLIKFNNGFKVYPYSLSYIECFINRGVKWY